MNDLSAFAMGAEGEQNVHFRAESFCNPDGRFAAKYFVKCNFGGMNFLDNSAAPLLLPHRMYLFNELDNGVDGIMLAGIAHGVHVRGTVFIEFIYGI